MSSPIYKRIAEELEEQRRELRVPQALPDELSLAARFSVARETIRRALKYLEARGAVTRRQRMGTFLQPAFPQTTSLRGKNVGIVPPWWADVPDSWYLSTIYEGIGRWADANECNFSILHVSSRPDNEQEWLDRLRARDLAGLVWVQPQMRQLKLLHKTAKLLPTVVLGREVPGNHLHQILPDYAKAAELIDGHFLKHGSPVYALVGKNIMDPFNQTWIDCVSRVQKARKQEFNPATRFFDMACFSQRDIGPLLLDFYLPAHADIRALVFLTSGYLHAPFVQDERFRERILADVSVMTLNYGPYPIESFWPGKTITHVDCDWAKLAWRAMEILSLKAEGHLVPEVVAEAVTLVPGDTVHEMRNLSG